MKASARIVVVFLLGLANAATAGAATGQRITFGSYSLVLPSGWVQRAQPFPDRVTRIVAYLSSGSLSSLETFELQAGQVVISIVPLGNWGSRTAPVFRARDFAYSPHVTGRGQVQAHRSFCSTGGQCFSLNVVLARQRPFASDIRKVNSILGSIVAAPASLTR